MKIIIDTSELQSLKGKLTPDLKSSSKNLRLLKSFIEAKEFVSVFIPEIVIKEHLKHISDDFNNRVKEYSIASKLFFGADYREVVLDEILGNYRDNLYRQLKAFPIHVVKAGKIEIEHLIERALEKRKPFDQKGRGFKDAVTWHSMLNIEDTKEGEDIILLSSDNDFAEKKEGKKGTEISRIFDSSLLAEWKEKQEGNLSLMSLSEFAEIYIKPSLKENINLISYIQDNAEQFIDSNLEKIENDISNLNDEGYRELDTYNAVQYQIDHHPLDEVKAENIRDINIVEAEDGSIFFKLTFNISLSESTQILEFNHYTDETDSYCESETVNGEITVSGEIFQDENNRLAYIESTVEIVPNIPLPQNILLKSIQ